MNVLRRRADRQKPLIDLKHTNFSLLLMNTPQTEDWLHRSETGSEETMNAAWELADWIHVRLKPDGHLQHQPAVKGSSII